MVPDPWMITLLTSLLNSKTWPRILSISSFHGFSPGTTNTPILTWSLVEAQDAWTKLARMMGPHRRMLTHVYIEHNETTHETCLSTEDEGIEIESWALSCESLSDDINPVSRKWAVLIHGKKMMMTMMTMMRMRTNPLLATVVRCLVAQVFSLV